jgi:hypothetical protein
MPTEKEVVMFGLSLIIYVIIGVMFVLLAGYGAYSLIFH